MVKSTTNREMNLHKCLGDICARARVDTIQFMQTIIDLEARRARFVALYGCEGDGQHRREAQAGVDSHLLQTPEFEAAQQQRAPWI